MEIIPSLSESPLSSRGGAIAIGVFDGVHLGHRSLLNRAFRIAEEIKGPKVVFTFGGHPLSVVAPESVPPALSSPALRRVIFADLGADFVLEEPFTAELSKMSAEDFLRKLQSFLAPKVIVVGENFTFGEGGRGTPEYLLSRGEEMGFRGENVPLFRFADETVSSTRIRRLLASGDVKTAALLLGRPFEIRGKVIHGEARGRTLGFPTANLALPKEYACPATGVYATNVVLEDGSSRMAVTNIGKNPTFGGVTNRVEAHILDFAGDLYEKEITVKFAHRLRGEKRFPTAKALAKQIREDEKTARKLLQKANGGD